LERKDGSIAAAFPQPRGGEPEALADPVLRLVQGEARYRFLQRLANDDPAAPVRLDMRLVPVEVRDRPAGANAPVRYRRDAAPRRTPEGRLLLREGEFFMVELRNRSRFDVFVTVLDLRPDGTIGPIWPHPGVPVDENRIEASGEWIRLPEPFIYEAEPPHGREVLKAIATRQQADFSPLLDRNRGAREQPRSPVGQLLRMAVLDQRAKLSGQDVDPAEWGTAEVAIEVTPKEAR
jgi:hypothetical protein